MDQLACEFCGDYMGEEDTIPRVLRCGHTFCTPCVSEFYRGSEYKCPTCRRHLHSKYFSSIPVNHALLKVIKAKMSSGNKNVKDLKILQAVSTNDKSKCSDDGNTSQSVLDEYEKETAPSPNEPPQHAGKCNIHDTYCLFWCKSCKEWICHYCFVTAHPPLVCEIRYFDQALHEIKFEEDLCINKTVELFDNHADKYSERISALKERRERNRALIKELRSLLSKHHDAKRDVEKQTEAIKSNLTDGLSTLSTLLESQRRLLEAQTSDEVFSARHQAQVYQSKILDWDNQNSPLLNEEIAFSDELQKSTFTAIAVLKDLLSSSDNNDIKFNTSGLTTLPRKDDEAVARNLKYLLENSEWKDIIAKIEKNQFSSDNSLHCLANIPRRTNVRQYDFEEGLDESDVIQDKQKGAKTKTCRKFEVPDENLIDLTSDEREFRGRCHLPEKQCLTPDITKHVGYHSMNTHFSAERKPPLSPQLERISETEESLETITWTRAWQEDEQKDIGKSVVVKGRDDDQVQLVKRIGLSKDCHGKLNQITMKSPGFKEIDFVNEGTVKRDHSRAVFETDSEHIINREVHDKTYFTCIRDLSKDPSKIVTAASKENLIYAKEGKNFPDNLLTKRDDSPNFGVDSSASEVIDNEYGRQGSSELGGIGSTVSRGNTIAVSRVGNVVSGVIIVVAGEADEDDDAADDSNLSTKEYKCDTILPEGKENYEIGRTERRLKTRGILLEGGNGQDRDAFIQDNNKEEKDAALCKDKGIGFDEDNKKIGYVHMDEETKTLYSGYQTEDVYATDRHYHTTKRTQTESDHSGEIFLTPTIEFGAEHYPVGYNDSLINSDKEAGEIEIAYGIESDTTVAIEDLNESQRYMRGIITESNGDSAIKITGAEAFEDRVENTDVDANEKRIGDRCWVM